MEGAQLAGNGCVRPKPGGPPMRALQAAQVWAGEGGGMGGRSQTGDGCSFHPHPHPPHPIPLSLSRALEGAVTLLGAPPPFWGARQQRPARTGAGGAQCAQAAGWPAPLGVRTPGGWRQQRPARTCGGRPGGVSGRAACALERDHSIGPGAAAAPCLYVRGAPWERGADGGLWRRRAHSGGVRTQLGWWGSARKAAGRMRTIARVQVCRTVQPHPAG